VLTDQDIILILCNLPCRVGTEASPRNYLNVHPQSQIMSLPNHQLSSVGAGHSRKRSRESKSPSEDEEMWYYNCSPQNSITTKKARPKSKPLDILFEVRCIQPGYRDKSFFQEKPFAGTDESTDLRVYLQTSVMDVFVDVTGTDLSGKQGYSRATFIPDPRRETFILGKDFRVSRLTTPGMYIWSHHIQKMLRGLVKYYPSQYLLVSESSSVTPIRCSIIIMMRWRNLCMSVIKMREVLAINPSSNIWSAIRGG
jgi:hypothetical protein